MTRHDRELENEVLENPFPVDAIGGLERARGPQSETMKRILLLLYSRPMKSSEIAAILGKSSRYVSSYLSYWKSRGFVTYVAGYWCLTPLGKQYVELYISTIAQRRSRSIARRTANKNDMVGLLDHNKTYEQVSQTMNNKKKPDQTRHGKEVQPFIAEFTGSEMGNQNTLYKPTSNQAISICIQRFMNSSGLDEDEIEILEYLVNHYSRWGSTYVYLDQIVEDLNYSPAELLRILKKLQSKRIVYIYTDRRLGTKIGLGKSLKQFLAKCIESLDLLES